MTDAFERLIFDKVDAILSATEFMAFQYQRDPEDPPINETNIKYYKDEVERAKTLMKGINKYRELKDFERTIEII